MVSAYSTGFCSPMHPRVRAARTVRTLSEASIHRGVDTDCHHASFGVRAQFSRLTDIPLRQPFRDAVLFHSVLFARLQFKLRQLLLRKSLYLAADAD